MGRRTLEQGMKTLVISGASSGIGLHTARLFLERGYEVVNLSRRRCPLDKATHINCDLAQPGFIDNAGSVLRPLLERSDETVLIHNASRLTNDSSLETPGNALRAVLEVNVVAPNSLNYFVLPFMRPGSSILFVASTLSEKAVPGSFSYVTSKHAQIGMMRSLTQDLAGRGIHTAAVCPGFTDTEMLRQHVPAEAMDSVRRMSAFDRLISPDEIANTLLFVAQNPVLNGSVIHANLGQIER
jgi:NAD(P)-dependent dehydrogenase (short-subunit alcohol dehydrogenase family)